MKSMIYLFLNRIRHEGRRLRINYQVQRIYAEACERSASVMCDDDVDANEF